KSNRNKFKLKTLNLLEPRCPGFSGDNFSLASPVSTRSGNRMPFEGASDSDHAQGSLKPEDGFKNLTTMPVKRHSDAVFTNNYSRLRKRIAVKKYLDSILTEEKR
uniref:Glucagon / GIP / secretin / VIP family domain-containing protein n=1 Tax=Anolis carolinensis TaxID=28377 RepID=A0A803SWM9_ANOCA